MMALLASRFAANPGYSRPSNSRHALSIQRRACSYAGSAIKLTSESFDKRLAR